MTIRNSFPYVRRCVEHLISQSIGVIILDHTSDDGSYELCLEYETRGVERIERMPFDGTFSLTEQLRQKSRLADEADADWIIHQDVDELLDSPDPNETLHDAIARADRAGANCINFEEFVFLPYPDHGTDFYASRHYYYYRPTDRPRLMRAWRKGSGLDGLKKAGHVVAGPVALFPETFVLRHYPFTDQAHAIAKYRDREFAASDLAQGWHANRRAVDAQKLVFPDKAKLTRAATLDVRGLDRSRPWTKHYWEE